MQCIHAMKTFSPSVVIKAVSMGQGQEYHARKMMTECMAGGKRRNLVRESKHVFINIYFRWLGTAAECSSLIELLR